MIPLCSERSQSIVGPFEFEKIDAFNRTRQKAETKYWKMLYDECVNCGIVPPTFGSNSTQLPPTHYSVNHKRKLGEL